MNKTASKRRTCQRCTSLIPASVTDQLCPACLMSQALAAPDQETLSWGSGRAPEERDSAPWPRALGDYRLLRLLGSGGMGRVYEAEHRSTGRRVALKCLGHRLDSPEMRQRFLREGRLAASVSHPHSLYVFGSEEIAGSPVITMEIAESGTLKDELTKRGPLPVKEAVDAILDVISGLRAAQAVGVLHRDVKPSNCFVTSDGSVKVGDYGLSISSLALDDSYATASGHIMGTPAYASPEQLRGDDLDLRADIYSVGATLYTLLTGRAPFEGHNAVQVVANAVKLAPRRAGDLRDGLPLDLERIVTRCLAKEPSGRFDSYGALRDALLPFSSRENQPAPMKVRVAAGWIDFLFAFFVPYVGLMLLAGGAEFHFGWLMERTVYSARYYLAFLAFGLAYFTVAEGYWGAGFGKRHKGLRVMRQDGRRPGPLRALIRILSPIVVIEAVRLPLLLSLITATSLDEITGGQILIYSLATTLCPWAPALLNPISRRANGFATPWGLLSGTRVVFKPSGAQRPSLEPIVAPVKAFSQATQFGPYRLDGEMTRGCWLTATDVVLRRPVWLLKREGSDPSDERRGIARPGRPRWLQKVEAEGAAWDAYEASPGMPFSSLIASGKRIPWSDLRFWLHDLASELWAAATENTLDPQLSLNHIWLTADGHAQLLDDPWPAAAGIELIPVSDLAGQQRFLHAVASSVEPTSLPLHARPVCLNLAQGRFEKLSFLAGTLRGLLDRPATLSRGVRAGALFMLPIYTLVMTLIGASESSKEFDPLVGGFFGSFAFFVLLLILTCSAIEQLLLVPWRTTSGHSLFRLAVVDATGRLASRKRLLVRWGASWLPLIGALTVTMQVQHGLAKTPPRIWLILWLGAVLHAALDPDRGLHDRLAGTWVVRR